MIGRLGLVCFGQFQVTAFAAGASGYGLGGHHPRITGSSQKVAALGGHSFARHGTDEIKQVIRIRVYEISWLRTLGPRLFSKWDNYCILHSDLRLELNSV